MDNNWNIEIYPGDDEITVRATAPKSASQVDIEKYLDGFVRAYAVAEGISEGQMKNLIAQTMETLENDHSWCFVLRRPNLDADYFSRFDRALYKKPKLN